MRNSIDPAAQARRRKDAWQSAISSTLLRALLGAAALGLRWVHRTGGLIGSLLVILAVLDWGSIPFIWIVRRKRLEEMEGGEEDAASQY